MKLTLLLKTTITFCLVAAAGFVSAQNFTWVKGTSLTGQTGLYGLLGTPNPGNNPGSREGAASWKDASGNFWLFGGDGRDFIGNAGYLNDLWRYNRSTNEWTWIKGDNVVAQVGVYGTQGVAAAGNKPGSRSVPVIWQDANGNVYLLGGYGYDATGTLGYLNDLWKYDPGTNQWTWLKGSTACYQPCSYGVQSTPAPSNVPGARYSAVGWTDASNNLWLFGGFGNTTTSLTVGYLNDLWKYNLSTNQWAWMGGSMVADQNGAYGIQAISSSSNYPGARSTSVSWQDATGNFWLFGGKGFDSVATASGYLNDLWKYNPTAGQWVWQKGSKLANQSGNYGNASVSSPSNTPGGRNASIGWIDGIGTLWLAFGEGYGVSASGTGKLSDLWKYNVAANEWTWVRGSSNLDLPGVYGTIGNPAQSNIPGARRHSTCWIDASSNLWLFGGYGQPATGAAGQLNDLWKYTNCFIAPISITITSSHSLVCAGEQVVLSVTGSNNYTWGNGSNSSTIVVTPTASANTYTASTSNSNTCVYSAVFTQSTNACVGLNERGSDVLSLYPNPSKGTLVIESSQHNHISILNGLGQLAYEQKLAAGKNSLNLDLKPGVYYCRLSGQNGSTKVVKLLVE